MKNIVMMFLNPDLPVITLRENVKIDFMIARPWPGHHYGLLKVYHIPKNGQSVTSWENHPTKNSETKFIAFLGE